MADFLLSCNHENFIKIGVLLPYQSESRSLSCWQWNEPFLAKWVLTYFCVKVWIIVCFYACSRIFHLYGDVTIVGEGLENLGLYAWYLGPLSREGSLLFDIRVLWQGASIFQVSSKELPHSVASYDTQGGVEDLF
jgi:hypothetical protein